MTDSFCGLTFVQKEFTELLVTEEALKFGEFTLKSGRKSPFFVNLGDLSSGQQLASLVGAYGETIQQKRLQKELKDFNVVFGPAYKGIPLAACIAMYLYNNHDMEISYCANRKEVKDHGDVGSLLGAKLKDGDRVLIVEDVMTSGKSIDEVVPIIRAQGDVEIVGEIIALDRCERAADTTESALSVISKKYGFPVMPILRMDNAIQFLRSRNVIADDLYQRIQEYYTEYGANISLK